SHSSQYDKTVNSKHHAQVYPADSNKSHSVFLVIFFFFQAEDGIRDFHVTGVQTCALPIWNVQAQGGHQHAGGDLVAVGDAHNGRSEERRVGKECRAGGAPYEEEEDDDVGGLLLYSDMGC